jgi:hypothetical protein
VKKIVSDVEKNSGRQHCLNAILKERHLVSQSLMLQEKTLTADIVVNPLHRDHQ